MAVAFTTSQNITLIYCTIRKILQFSTPYFSFRHPVLFLTYWCDIDINIGILHLESTPSVWQISVFNNLLIKIRSVSIFVLIFSSQKEIIFEVKYHIHFEMLKCDTLQSLPRKVNMQYLHFRSQVQYFLLPFKIPEVVSRRSVLFHN